MRLKQSRLNTYYHCVAEVKKDREGSGYVEYGTQSPFKAEQWPAGGKLQQEMYGIRMSNIRNLRIEEKFEEVIINGKVSYMLESGMAMSVGDGICMHEGQDAPDYKIIAIYPYRFLTLEVEKT